MRGRPVLRGWISPTNRAYFAFRIIRDPHKGRVPFLYSIQPQLAPSRRILALQVDTGFNGDLSMPPGWIHRLDTARLADTSVTLADQRTIVTRLYDAHVRVEGIHNMIFNVDLIPGSPLLGMGFMKMIAPLLTVEFVANRVALWR